MQVQQHGLWPTLQQLIRGLQGGHAAAASAGRAAGQAAGAARQPGGPQTRAQRKQRFEEVARAVQALPMEEFVTRQDLERCSLHTPQGALRPGTYHIIVPPLWSRHGAPAWPPGARC